MSELAAKPESCREKCEQYAHVVFAIGVMIEDRRVGTHEDGTPGMTDEDQEKLWDYLWNENGWIYSTVGPLADQIEDEVFGGPVEWR